MNADRIEQIKQASNLTELVKEFGVSLKAGRGKCPFCESKSEAFGVKNNYYHCFKCEAKGDVVEFVKQSQNLDFISAIKYLANRTGIATDESITKTAGDEPKAAADMYLKQRGLEIPKDWYSQEAFGYRSSLGDKHSATVRFPIGATYWERIVDSHLFNRKANFGGAYKGECWQPPEQRICKGDRIYITEGIFDAIAIKQSLNYKVASAMSTSNFPQKLVEKYQGKKITWCLMLDFGDAGKLAAKKWANILIGMGEKVEVYYPKNHKDWNDLHRTKQLNDDLLKQYWWRGQTLVARSASERMAWVTMEAIINNKFTPNSQVLSFGNCYFNCKIVKTDISDREDLASFYTAIENSEYFEAVSLIKPLISAHRISTATAKLLYTQIDNIDETYSYCFEVGILGVKKNKNIVFDSNMIVDSKSFNLALLKKVGQATFSGESKDMRHILDGWFANRKPTVETIRHMGYSPLHKAYVFEKFGYKDGQKALTNKHDYLNIGSLSLKTTFKGWNIPTPTPKQANWFNDLYLSGGNNALTGLAFWLASLFAAQIREQNNQGTIPFFEYTGVAHSGKSTTIEFLWKLIGRDGFEGEDPEKMTTVALSRYLMQASNIPVVLLEGDREPSRHHQKNFSMDNLKTLFRGQSPRGRGTKDNGINIDNVPFLGTLVISQNSSIKGEAQIISRIVQCIATKNDFSPEGLAASNRLKTLKSEQVINFLHNALSKEKQIMSEYEKWFSTYKTFLLNKSEIYDARIAENHAQIMAFGKCLQLIVNDLDDDKLKKWLEFMTDLAKKRQIACQSDSVLVDRFWEIYETFNEKIGSNDNDNMMVTEQLNHSKDNTLIAINLPLFKKFAEENRQQIDLEAAKTSLLNSKRYKFITQKKIDSQILGKIVHCWVFKK